MATRRSHAVLQSADGTTMSGTAALFTEPERNGGIPRSAGLTLAMPDGRSGKVIVQSLKGGSKNAVLALMGEDLAPF